MNTLKLSLLALPFIFASGTFAHTDEYLDTQIAPHSGQLRMAGAQHYELVVKPIPEGWRFEERVHPEKGAGHFVWPPK